MGPEPSIGDLLRAAMQRHQAGRLAEAEQLYRGILRRDPRQPDALHYLGLIAQQVGKIDQAIDFIGRSLAINPANPAYHVNLAVILQGLGRYDEAMAHCRRAIELAPTFSEGHANLGAVFCSSGSPELGIPHLRRALELEPRNLKARYNLADALSQIGDYAQAQAEYQRTLAADPNFAKARFGLGLMQLREGDFERGLAGYEWRWRIGDPSIVPRHFAAPMWDGSELKGRRILIYTEQGYGDAIQLARYVPQVADRGGKVVLECLPGLERLFESLVGVERLVNFGQPLPEHDLRCPLLSLPFIFETRLDTVPANVPYLRAPADLSRCWKEKLECDAGAKGMGKVGLAWAGNPRHTNDRNRSITPEVLEPLSKIPGVALYSLQKRQGNSRFTSDAAPPGVRDFTSQLNDFADTAALIDNLDLVISVDTAVAHLAGAMGKPLWLLVPFVPDWRWLLGRGDSPWYPTMRIFRQPRLRDWASAISQVASELQKCAGGMR